MYYVYMLRNKNGKTYTGYTSDLKARISSHNNGENTSTRGHMWELIYYEAYKSKKDAVNRELSLKKSGQARRWLKERIEYSLSDKS